MITGEFIILMIVFSTRVICLWPILCYINVSNEINYVSSINNQLPDPDVLVPMFWFREGIYVDENYANFAKVALKVKYGMPYGFWAVMVNKIYLFKGTTIENNLIYSHTHIFTPYLLWGRRRVPSVIYHVICRFVSFHIHDS